jgi:reverse gyrase
VKAQITRRIADRWVGFTLSQILWRVFNRKDLSAGRVQTPVLGWIIERNEEFKKKIYKVVLDLGRREIAFLVEDKALAYEMQREPEKIRVMWGKEWEEEKGTPPPYTTDTILQDSRLPADKTMEILQELFEKGFITYHRTDSTRVSEFGKYSVAKPIIAKDFGEEMFYPRSWGEGGAHECIRPTRPIRPDELRLMMSLGSVEFEDPKNTLRIYSLIFNRFLASQMIPAKVKLAEIIVLYNGFAYVEEVVREILQDGYNLVLPNIRVWDGELQVKGVNFLKVPKVQPYTQGTLIQEMKKRGLGRPSTYAQIVKTLLERGYVVEKKGYLFPTKMGIVVYKFLSGKFGEFVSEEFTRKLEEEMDIIEEGRKDFVETLREIYGIKGYLQP